ncbi:hypothetical protein CK203_029302 [Vitis vinifera]|uniref:DUF4283 domain-containing protein n=1 Tax=Vitis vinifera TaxID=29760 RepID=A0A438IT22_VITVI|nr:hypothetical protein CK203_029302 [Vitis vinifera]
MTTSSEVREGLKGGKCWFAVESKTFEISIEVARGVEDWCRGKPSSRCLKVWEDEGRKFRLECRSNEKEKVSRGVVLVGYEVRALGVSTPALSKAFSGVSTSIKGGCSFKGKEKRKGTEEQLSRCLVGCFGDSFELVPPLSSLKGWALASWILRGGLKISKLGGVLVLFEFKNKCEAELVLLKGNKRFKERGFLLQRWRLEVGCFWNEIHAKEVWVRIVGISLHLWSREVFKRIGETCGGFIAIDEKTIFFSQLQWTYILVRAIGNDLLGSLQVVVKHTCWTREVRDEGVGGAHASESVQETQLGDQSWGSEEQIEYGRRNRGAVGVMGRQTKWTDLDSALRPDELEEAFSGSKGSTTGAIDWDPLRVVPIEDLLVLDGRKEPP